MLKSNNIKSKKQSEKVPHFPLKPHKALTNKELEPLLLKSGTETEFVSFGMENTDFLSSKKNAQKSIRTREGLNPGTFQPI